MNHWKSSLLSSCHLDFLNVKYCFKESNQTQIFSKAKELHPSIISGTIHPKFILIICYIPVAISLMTTSSIFRLNLKFPKKKNNTWCAMVLEFLGFTEILSWSHTYNCLTIKCQINMHFCQVHQFHLELHTMVCWDTWSYDQTHQERRKVCPGTSTMRCLW